MARCEVRDLHELSAQNAGEQAVEVVVVGRNALCRERRCAGGTRDAYGVGASVLGVGVGELRMGERGTEIK